MGLVSKVAGGYFSIWVIGMGSSIIMLLVAFLVSMFTNEGTILNFMYFLYNSTVSIFILLMAVPIGLAMVVIIPLWNMINDFIAPLLAVVIDPIFGGLAKLFGVPYTSFGTIAVRDQSAYSFVLSFTQLLKGFSDFIFTEVVG